ncbi:PulJ/GspJ family protein [Marisediminicola senii]|uniref:PulJ/GspJ family protein n=1 Tax=Marisediminicola senii TaxID=2711233 RepID=UPI0022A7EB2E|nr:prepilin-type N-terminal cleavage/methylation domain-containing protein [Marisediminicola senii]
MTLQRSRRDSRDDQGFTLIEMLVATMILTLVMSIVGGLVISMVKTDRSVRATTAATTQGQLVTESIERGIRNSMLSTTPAFALTAPVTGDQFLVARTAGSASTLVWRCTAWYYSASERTIRSFSSTAQIAAPSSATRSGWTLLAEGVRPAVSGGTVFSQSSSSTGQTLQLALTVDAGTSPRVAFTTSATSRVGTVTGAPTCF